MSQVENSTFERLRRAHQDLLIDLRAMQEAVQRSSGKTLAQIRDCLGKTCVYVCEHFHLEEQNGYLDVVTNRDPRLERHVQRLAEEHRQLIQDLDSLAEAVASTSKVSDSLRDQIRQWIFRVRQHEIREDDLIQDAFNLDLGAPD